MFQDEMLPELPDDLLERNLCLQIIEQLEPKIAPFTNQETVLPLL